MRQGPGSLPRSPGREGLPCPLKLGNRSAQLRAEAEKEARTPRRSSAEGRGTCPGGPSRTLDFVAEEPPRGSPHA